MIVTFQPTINATSDYTACYLNFLRCVTAIATAAAGTSSLTVRPYTASGVIDTSTNCIISIDANTEAGGWTTSTSHSVPSSLSNTATTYTALASTTLYQYKADFYNTSGKSAYPYKKLCFHSYGTGNYSLNPWSNNNSGAWNITNVTANQGNNMLITFGCSTSTDWTSTTFPPAGGITGSINNTAGLSTGVYQSTSWTLNAMVSSFAGLMHKPGLCYNDPGIQYHMAVTADYCVIWESKVGDSYNTGYFTTPTTGNGTSYWNASRYGSVYYMGLRENQPWETPLTNNPPWVCWQHTQDLSSNGNGVGNAYSQNQVAAFMLTTNNSGVVNTTPKIYATINHYQTDFFHQFRASSVVDINANGVAYGYQYGVHTLDGPLFQTRAMYNVGPYVNNTAQPTSSVSSNYPENGNSTNMLYMPQYDTVTGLFVPGAWPIKISRSYTGDWNPGGACRGIYKSLSMPFATMKNYWQSATQTFTVNGDQYLPFVLNEDMFLVRFA